MFLGRFSPKKRAERVGARFGKHAALIRNTNIAKFEKAASKLSRSEKNLALRIATLTRKQPSDVSKRDASSVLEEALNLLHKKGGYHARIGHVIGYGMRLVSKRMFPFERCFSEAMLAIPEFHESQDGGGVLFTLRSLYRRGRNAPRYAAHVLAKLHKFAIATDLKLLRASIEKKLYPDVQPPTKKEVAPQGTTIDPNVSGTGGLLYAKRIDNQLSILVDEMSVDTPIGAFKDRVIERVVETNGSLWFRNYFEDGKYDDSFNAALALATSRIDKLTTTHSSFDGLRERERMMAIIDERLKDMSFPATIEDYKYCPAQALTVLQDVFKGRTIRPIRLVKGNRPKGLLGNILYFPVRLVGFFLMVPALQICGVVAIVAVYIFGPAVLGLMLAAPELL